MNKFGRKSKIRKDKKPKNLNEIEKMKTLDNFEKCKVLKVLDFF